jgi:hypothetical protein
MVNVTERKIDSFVPDKNAMSTVSIGAPVWNGESFIWGGGGGGLDLVNLPTLSRKGSAYSIFKVPDECRCGP